VFSPDGRTIAFESAREGELAVYARPALGGAARRLTPPGRQFSVVAWRGAPAAYVERLRIVAGAAIALGDTARLDIIALTPDGRAIPSRDVRWALLDRGAVEIPPTSRNSALYASTIRAVGANVGSARLVAEIPGWRADTLAVAVSGTQPVHVEDRFDNPQLDTRWLRLGNPEPRIGRLSDGTAGLFPNGDLEWESGVLLRSTLALRGGLRMRLRLHAAFGGRASPATLALGFVTAVPEAAVDRVSPRFTPLVGVRWDGASGNLVYTLGPESSSESASAFGPDASHVVEIAINANGAVVFSVDGKPRWTASRSALGDVRGMPVQLWIGGRATGASIAVSDFSLDLPARQP
jgi:hypothetical protein